MPEPTTIATRRHVPTASAVALRARSLRINSRAGEESRERGSQGLETFRHDSPHHAPAPLLASQKSGIREGFGVVTDRRLRLAQRFLQVTGTHLTTGSDEAEQ